jgi:acetyl/propionyl-CoA carboxylase alpha subunit
VEFFLLYLANCRLINSIPMHKIKINEKTYEVNFSHDNNKGLVNGVDFELDLAQKNESQFHLIKSNQSYCIDVLDINYQTKNIVLKINGQVYEGTVEDDLDILLKKMGIENKPKSGANELHAPMPGLVLAVNIEKGQLVTKGDTLIVLEAMKMENNLKAEGDLVVKDIHCSKGNTVNKNQLLISFENS